MGCQDPAVSVEGGDFRVLILPENQQIGGGTHGIGAGSGSLGISLRLASTATFTRVLVIPVRCSETDLKNIVTAHGCSLQT